MKLRVIYKIVNPNGRIYIGQSLNFKKRMNAYRSLNCTDQPKLYNSLKKYGLEKHKISVLTSWNYNQDQINLLEEEYIKVFNSNSINNLNITSGGLGTSGSKRSKESKLKMSLARIKLFKNGYIPYNLGLSRTEEQNESLSHALKERYKDKTKHGRFGKTNSEETKEKIRQGLARYREAKKLEHFQNLHND